MPEDTPRLSRRAQYAEQTRTAIIDAARKLFAERGFFATKVDDVAAEARVAPATVYAVAGGKQGLLNELVRIWSTDPAIGATLELVNQTNSGPEIIAITGRASRSHRERFGDLMRILLNTAPHDPTVAQQLADATEQYRSELAKFANRLMRLRALREDIDEAYAVDMLWFYFGYSSYFTLHDDNGWSYSQAERWLVEHASRELLAPDDRQI
ncbi:MAG: TetR/AcrR family transcriptional regulator [Solirubrobacteraceae bacterium]